MACRLSLLLVAALFFLVCVSPSFANSSDTYRGYPAVKVIVNGDELKNDIPAIVLDGRTLVPLRSVYEALGANVQWDPLLLIQFIFHSPHPVPHNNQSLSCVKM
jgi:branched-chain amino acid transport system substrate-binding protein